MIRAGNATILIDTSSDFRQQMLTHGVKRIDAVLLTHAHFDHIGGFDDLRQFNFLQRGAVDLFGSEHTLAQVRATFRYAFGDQLQEGGGVPQVRLHPIDSGTVRVIAGVPVLPLHVMHGMLPVLGFRIGAVAYITDCNHIPDETFSLLEGLDILILDALRHERHPTHFNLEESIAAARRIGARNTYFTHIAHNIMHARDSHMLPDTMAFCSDGMELTSLTDAA